MEGIVSEKYFWQDRSNIRRRKDFLFLSDEDADDDDDDSDGDDDDDDDNDSDIEGPISGHG